MRTADALTIGMALGRIKGTLDAWEESKHPRRPDGKFGSGGGGKSKGGKMHPEYEAAMYAVKQKEKSAKKRKPLMKNHIEGAEGYRKAINEQIALQTKYASEGNMKKANEAYKAGMKLFNEAVSKGISESSLM